MPLRKSLCYFISFFALVFISGCGDNDSPTGHNETIDEISIVINEINYNSSDVFDPGDWVEFYNAGASPVDVSGWTFMDEDNTHVFVLPDGTGIPSDGFLVLCADTTAFRSLSPEVGSYKGDLGFGFSGQGELIRLYNSQGELIDQVAYDDDAPWPVEADGLGSTLSLVDPARDNNIPENWAASLGHGTPGAVNDVGAAME